MFYGYFSLKEFNISDIDTSHVTNMSHMFYECKSLEQLNLTNFNTTICY